MSGEKPNFPRYYETVEGWVNQVIKDREEDKKDLANTLKNNLQPKSVTNIKSDQTTTASKNNIYVPPPLPPKQSNNNNNTATSASSKTKSWADVAKNNIQVGNTLASNNLNNKN